MILRPRRGVNNAVINSVSTSTDDKDNAHKHKFSPTEGIKILERENANLQESLETNTEQNVYCMMLRPRRGVNDINPDIEAERSVSILFSTLTDDEDNVHKDEFSPTKDIEILERDKANLQEFIETKTKRNIDREIMFRPRRCVNKLNIEAEISALALISPEDEDNVHKDEFSPAEIIEILERDNASLQEFIEIETKRKNELLTDLERWSENIELDERIISSCRDYVENKDAELEETSDLKMELFFKFEVLHRIMCRLIKKTVNTYSILDLEDEFTVAADIPGPSTSLSNVPRRVNRKTRSTRTKSLLDTLKLLIPELTEGSNTDGVLEMNDTINPEVIEFLVQANIIEKCSDRPNHFKLINDDQ